MTAPLLCRLLAFGCTVLCAGVLPAGCHARPAPRYSINIDCIPDWSLAPLLPPIHFREPTTAGTITTLLLDAHSGTPIRYGRIYLQGTNLASADDSAGRVILHGVPPGRHVLVAQAVGYEVRQDTVSVTHDTGWALVLQLRRRYGGGCTDTSFLH